jgi:hypothetical protein
MLLNNFLILITNHGIIISDHFVLSLIYIYFQYYIIL